MMEHIDFLIYKSRYIFVGIITIISALILLWVLLAGFSKTNAQTTDTDFFSQTQSTNTFDNTNIITSGMASAANVLQSATGSFGKSMTGGFQSFAKVATKSGTIIRNGIVSSVIFVGSGINNTLAFTANIVASVITFVAHIPTGIFGLFSKSPVVSSVIKPADHNPVPIIDPNSPALAEAKQALPATQNTGTSSSQASVPAVLVAIWPIHGWITTRFGVPELPYEAIHTGLDITDGRPAGVTPIKAYRGGRVVATEHTGGLGNHVIVDHGSGVTSVYGHLASISVVVGQIVDTNTTIGYEGSTGVSTGTHLHFEIRVNGQAADPHQFINGQP